jgi:polyhydroxybutyrate depolymerase
VIDPFPKLRTWVDRLRSRRLRAEAIRHDGLVRSYLLYVPQHFRRISGRPLPLVVMLHGGAGRPGVMARVSAMHRIAEREGFIVAYPAGTPGRLGLTWNVTGQALNSDVDDVDFVRALISSLRQRYQIDPRRVYAAGMSMGGMLAYKLACALSESFAAVGIVAGVMTTDDCSPSSPVSVIHIHGTADQRVPLQGGRGRYTASYNNWPPVRRGIERWCEINRCRGPVEVIRLVEGVVGHRRTGDADVELWLVKGGRHVWPGASKGGWWWWWRRPAATTEFSASEKVWNFFAAHPQAKKLSEICSRSIP